MNGDMHMFGNISEVNNLNVKVAENAGKIHNLNDEVVLCRDSINTLNKNLADSLKMTNTALEVMMLREKANKKKRFITNAILFALIIISFFV